MIPRGSRLRQPQDPFPARDVSPRRIPVQPDPFIPAKPVLLHHKALLVLRGCFGWNKHKPETEGRTDSAIGFVWQTVLFLTNCYGIKNGQLCLSGLNGKSYDSIRKEGNGHEEQTERAV
jgi:hypothetical protein